MYERVCLWVVTVNHKEVDYIVTPYRRTYEDVKKLVFDRKNTRYYLNFGDTLNVHKMTFPKHDYINDTQVKSDTCLLDMYYDVIIE